MTLLHDPVDQLSFLISLLGLVPTAYFGMFVDTGTSRRNGFWNIYGLMIVCLGVIHYRWERGAGPEDSIVLLIAFAVAALLLLSSRGRRKTRTLKALGSSRAVFALSVFVVMYGFFGDWRTSAMVAVVSFLLAVAVRLSSD